MAFAAPKPLLNAPHQARRYPFITMCSTRSEPGARFSRRQFGELLSAAAVAAVLVGEPPAAHAVSGLKIFPLEEPLTNSYVFMRAAESISDARGVVNSNPVDKLRIESHGLTPRGVEQAMRASDVLLNAGVDSEAWLWPSVTTSCMETAEILAYQLNIRREKLVPEFGFLDARGVGAMNGQSQKGVSSMLQKLDSDDPRSRPPPGEDGTPSDSTEDVFVRVRQLLCKLETQYFGETIIVVSPDSDPLSILQATLMDEDLRSHHKFDYTPGEVRKIREKVVKKTSGEVMQRPGAEVLVRFDSPKTRRMS